MLELTKRKPRAHRLSWEQQAKAQEKYWDDLIAKHPVNQRIRCCVCHSPRIQSRMIYDAFNDDYICSRRCERQSRKDSNGASNRQS